ncbi:MAG: hypothetical protein KGM24_04365 [Elusimicrobia bacterium]|nr:hypothetical protein [Elusimicrobiota bacterium]
MTDLPRVWTAFGGASLALMGLALAGGARRHAADLAAWRRERRLALGEPEPPGGDVPSPLEVLAYRIGGALLSLVGAALAAAASAGSVRAAGPAGTRLGAALAGAVVSACGVGFGTMKTLAGRRGPRFLRGEELADDAPRRLDERLADGAVWTLCALWAVFGALLARAALR